MHAGVWGAGLGMVCAWCLGDKTGGKRDSAPHAGHCHGAGQAFCPRRVPQPFLEYSVLLGGAEWGPGVSGSLGVKRG